MTADRHGLPWGRQNVLKLTVVMAPTSVNVLKTAGLYTIKKSEFYGM